MTAGALELAVSLLVIVAAVAVIVLLVPMLRRRQRPVGRQVAAVPVRRATDGSIEVLLISTRGSGRWTVPKGWPMRGRSNAQAAAQEAYEEAGVRGSIVSEPVGVFEYVKARDDRRTLLVTVYRLDVEREARRFRERGERERLWLPASDAADRIAWPGLADIVRSLESPS